MPSSAVVSAPALPGRSAPRIERRDAVLIGTVVLGYLALWWALDATPFQDVPNHVSRAVVIGDLLLDGGARFGRIFEFDWMAVPYLLGDLLLLPLVRVLPVDVAARAWVALEWLALPLATAWLLRTWRCAPAVVAAGALLACYLATDVFFAMGFTNYRLGLAIAIAGVAAWERVQETPSPARWAALAVASAAAWLMHLAGLVFLVGILAVLAVLRGVRRAPAWRTAGIATALPAALLAWHVGWREPPNPAPPVQPAPATKVLRIAAPLVRDRAAPEIALFAGFVLVATVPLLAGGLPRPGERRFELAAVAAAFLGLYFVLPMQRGALWAVDTRALCVSWQFLALAAAESVAGQPRRESALVAAAALLALANLAWLAHVLGPQNERMRALRAVAEQVPAGAAVLPVLTLPPHGFTNPYAHAASYATIASGAIVPYTFSANEGMPMRYFRFRDRPPAPRQFWYQQGTTYDEWRAVRERYDFLYVTLPADWSAIPVPVRIVRSNGAAALARVVGAAGDARVRR